MLENLKKMVLSASMALAACILICGTALAADQKINVVFLSNESDEDYDGALVLKDYVESRSNGTIEVVIYPGGQLCGNPVECLEALQENLIQVFITTTGGISNIFPQIQVLDLPYMLSSDRVAECVLRGPLISDIRQEVLRKTGSMRLMTAGNTGGWRNFATTKKQIKHPVDVKGMRLRTISSPIQQELVKSMQGNPTPVAWPEVYTGLATGLVEGSKNGITDVVGMKFHEHIKYYTLDGHAYMGSLWWMNEGAFKQLSEDQKKVVIDGFDALSMTTIVLPKRRQIDAYQEFTAQGGTVYAPTAAEKAEFKTAAQPVYDWFVREYGSEWLEKANQAVAECRNQIEASYQAHHIN